MVNRKGIFNIKIRSQRRANIISITSPTAFRRSIRELRKGNYTLGDFRALTLARTRAKAMLNRKNLSPNERRQFREISKINIPRP